MTEMPTNPDHKETTMYDPDARERLNRCHIPIGADFHTLNSGQIEALLAEANLVKYRKPRNANGSRGRYFHALLQRRAVRNDN